MGLLRRILEENARAGTYNSLIGGAVSFAEMNARFERQSWPRTFLWRSTAE
jgi:hypothetical protein